MASTLHRMINAFQSALHDLGKGSHPVLTERTCSMVHSVMSSRERRFHAENHILSMCDGTHGLTTLAVLFHDMVYAQVDKLIHPLLESYLHEFSFDEQYCVCLPAPSDKLARFAYSLFHVHEGLKLSSTFRQNELLSAIAASRILFQSGIFTDWELIFIIACIESTIPFRPHQEAPMDRLYTSLMELQPDHEAVLNCMHACIDISHRDVADFGSEDTAKFLEGTWDLILEGNPVLRNPLYSIRQYREALRKMRSFVSSLQPENIFPQFQNIPDKNTCDELQRNTARNLSHATTYLNLKSLDANVLCAVSEITGGDAPMILFIGSTPSLCTEHSNHVLYRLLTHHSNRTTFDLAHSPFALLFLTTLSEKTLENLIHASYQYEQSQIGPHEYLALLPSAALGTILDTLMGIVSTRQNELLQLKKTLLAV